MGLRIKYLPFLFLSGYALCIWWMFASFSDLSRWIHEGLNVPYIGWAVIGGMAGILYHRYHKPIRDKVKNPMNKLAMGLALWLGSSILLSVTLGEGDLQERVLDSGLIRAWFVTMFGIFMSAPTSLGSYSIMTRSKDMFTLTMIGLLVVPLACMIYMQAKTVSVPAQGSLSSLITTLMLFGFVETFHWSRKYDRIEVQAGNLFARQLVSTIAFVGVASGLAFIAFSGKEVISDALGLYIYEMESIFGTGALGLALLSPLALIALIRSFRGRG